MVDSCIFSFFLSIPQAIIMNQILYIGIKQIC